MNDRKLIRCLACGGAELEGYLDLGAQPLANAYTAEPRSELPRYPLGLNLCRTCFHSQLTHAVDPDLMFKDYPYVSGTSESLRAYFNAFAGRVAGDEKYLRVLDIGSNDGSLLQAFRERGHAVIGVDPARGLAPDDIATLSMYWGEDAVAVLRDFGRDQFDIIVAMNVLAHTADPLGFLKACRSVLAPRGRIFVQTSQALMVEHGEFDTVYHEHHSFFTVSSFCALAARAGFDIKAIDHVPVHGTSHLVELWLPDDKFKNPGLEDFSVGWYERGHGYYRLGTYDKMQSLATIVANQVASTVGLFRREGWGIAGYGAAAKGMTFLNYAGIKLDVIFDDNPLKQGKYCAAGALVLPPAELPERMGSKAAAFVIPAWNMRDEIRAKIKALRPGANQDRFVTWFPTVRVTE